ncbi:hypothetical protein EJ06DRAFT_234303 [Trichodelitschia bisporula]|uniref:Uncharacterized protein n=1 Tax=Trichodelitschia bisporula TaxID=703511 RepID=A0A6G1HKC4_9PEZI|nr:hypothetical protein EJ06DRAFT_234303 [Trichodelitschia bisporula]
MSQDSSSTVGSSSSTDIRLETAASIKLPVAVNGLSALLSTDLYVPSLENVERLFALESQLYAMIDQHVQKLEDNLSKDIRLLKRTISFKPSSSTVRASPLVTRMESQVAEQDAAKEKAQSTRKALDHVRSRHAKAVRRATDVSTRVDGIALKTKEAKEIIVKADRHLQDAERLVEKAEKLCSGDKIVAETED